MQKKIEKNLKIPKFKNIKSNHFFLVIKIQLNIKYI